MPSLELQGSQLQPVFVGPSLESPSQRSAASCRHHGQAGPFDSVLNHHSLNCADMAHVEHVPETHGGISVGPRCPHPETVHGGHLQEVAVSHGVEHPSPQSSSMHCSHLQAVPIGESLDPPSGRLESIQSAWLQACPVAHIFDAANGNTQPQDTSINQTFWPPPMGPVSGPALEMPLQKAHFVSCPNKARASIQHIPSTDNAAGPSQMCRELHNSTSQRHRSHSCTAPKNVRHQTSLQHGAACSDAFWHGRSVVQPPSIAPSQNCDANAPVCRGTIASHLSPATPKGACDDHKTSGQAPHEPLGSHRRISKLARLAEGVFEFGYDNMDASTQCEDVCHAHSKDSRNAQIPAGSQQVDESSFYQHRRCYSDAMAGSHACPISEHACESSGHWVGQKSTRAGVLPCTGQSHFRWESSPGHSQPIPRGHNSSEIVEHLPGICIVDNEPLPAQPPIRHGHEAPEFFEAGWQQSFMNSPHHSPESLEVRNLWEHSQPHDLTCRSTSETQEGLACISGQHVQPSLNEHRHSYCRGRGSSTKHHSRGTPLPKTSCAEVAASGPPNTTRALSTLDSMIIHGPEHRCPPSRQCPARGSMQGDVVCRQKDAPCLVPIHVQSDALCHSGITTVEPPQRAPLHASSSPTVHVVDGQLMTRIAHPSMDVVTQAQLSVHLDRASSLIDSISMHTRRLQSAVHASRLPLSHGGTHAEQLWPAEALSKLPLAQTGLKKTRSFGPGDSTDLINSRAGASHLRTVTCDAGDHAAFNLQQHHNIRCASGQPNQGSAAARPMTEQPTTYAVKSSTTGAPAMSSDSVSTPRRSFATTPHPCTPPATTPDRTPASPKYSYKAGCDSMARSPTKLPSSNDHRAQPKVSSNGQLRPAVSVPTLLGKLTPPEQQQSRIRRIGTATRRLGTAGSMRERIDKFESSLEGLRNVHLQVCK
jgi:hypothetical protein